MTAVPYTTVRQNFKTFMQKVCDDQAPITITRQGGESVVMMSEQEYSSIRETLYLMSSPANAQRLLEAKERTRRGEYESHELISV